MAGKNTTKGGSSGTDTKEELLAERLERFNKNIKIALIAIGFSWPLVTLIAAKLILDPINKARDAATINSTRLAENSVKIEGISSQIGEVKNDNKESAEKTLASIDLVDKRLNVVNVDVAKLPTKDDIEKQGKVLTESVGKLSNRIDAAETQLEKLAEQTAKANIILDNTSTKATTAVAALNKTAMKLSDLATLANSVRSNQQELSKLTSSVESAVKELQGMEIRSRLVDVIVKGTLGKSVQVINTRLSGVAKDTQDGFAVDYVTDPAIPVGKRTLAIDLKFPLELKKFQALVSAETVEENGEVYVRISSTARSVLADLKKIPMKVPEQSISATVYVLPEVEEQ